MKDIQPEEMRSGRLLGCLLGAQSKTGITRLRSKGATSHCIRRLLCSRSVWLEEGRPAAWQHRQLAGKWVEDTGWNVPAHCSAPAIYNNQVTLASAAVAGSEH